MRQSILDNLVKFGCPRLHRAEIFDFQVIGYDIFDGFSHVTSDRKLPNSAIFISGVAVE